MSATILWRSSLIQYFQNVWILPENWPQLLLQRRASASTRETENYRRQISSHSTSRKTSKSSTRCNGQIQRHKLSALQSRTIWMVRSRKAVLLGQIEETFKLLSITPAYIPPNSITPNGFEQVCDAELSSAPIPQPRKTLVPKGSARKSSTLVIPFLQFPTEIRLKIYKHLLVVPLEKVWEECDRKKQDERVAIKLARKNLRRICRQVQGEWDPLFFSTTTITVRNLVPDWDSLLVPSINHNRPLMNFGELWHKGSEVNCNFPLTRPLGSGLFRTAFLERLPHYKLNDIRKLQYLIKGPSLNCLDLEDLKFLVRVLQVMKEDNLKSLEEVTICYKPLLPASGYLRVGNIWARCSEGTEKWDTVKAIFQPEGESGCFKDWTIVRRMSFNIGSDINPPRAMFVQNLRVHELQLVFCKSQQHPATGTSDWVELPEK
ncbi:hypothetical protein AYO22_02518 [Fonsecaea multimorphosa]|nr:hypothetical protein AYO22_02518 [Fonsecaea multimorphosa]